MSIENVTSIFCPASCGELVQGYIDDQPFLINAPINLFASARWTEKRILNKKESISSRFPKAAAAAYSIANNYPELKNMDLDIRSNIPRGKGMASSTAEISSTLAATMLSTNSFSLSELGKQVLETEEYTDATFMPGISYLNQSTGNVYYSWQQQRPEISLFVIDAGGYIDTCTVDRDKARSIARKYQTEYHISINKIHKGFSSSNSCLIGAAASLSTWIYQKILPNPFFELIWSLYQQRLVLGVCRAHTGTVLGILISPRKHCVAKIIHFLNKNLPRNSCLGYYSLINGGVYHNQATTGYLSRYIK